MISIPQLKTKPIDNGITIEDVAIIFYWGKNFGPSWWIYVIQTITGVIA